MNVEEYWKYVIMDGEQERGIQNDDGTPCILRINNK